MKTICQLDAAEIAQAIKDYAWKQGFSVTSPINFSTETVSCFFEVEKLPDSKEDDYEWAWNQGR
jgi:hypothetical protein